MYSLISLYLCFAKIYFVPLLTIRKPSTQCGELGFGKKIGDPFLTPPCTPCISPLLSDNFFNLEFRIGVINFSILEVSHVFTYFLVFVLCKNLFCAFVDEQCGELGFGKKIGVKNGDLQSNCFPCETGARQGKKLYPFLFALYLSDLEEYLSEIYVNHLEFGIKLYTTYRYVS
jgi:hypothetical protein